MNNYYIFKIYNICSNIHGENFTVQMKNTFSFMIFIVKLEYNDILKYLLL